MNLLADLAHAALHWQEMAHHHHDDGSVQLDDSQASTVHLHSDQLMQANALLPAAAHPFPLASPARPSAREPAAVPEPILDGPLRPPRPLA